MELSALISIVRRRWATALFAGLLVTGAVLAPAVLSNPTPQYEASSDVAFSGALIEREQYLINGDAQASRSASSFAATAQLPILLSDAKEATGIDDPHATVSSSTLGSDSASWLARVTVTAGSPADATALLDKVVDAAMLTTASVVPSTARGEPLVTTAVLGESTVVQVPASSGLAKQVVLALFAGLVVALGAAVVRHLCSARLVIVEDVVRAVAHRRSLAVEDGLVPPVVSVLGSGRDGSASPVRDEIETWPERRVPVLVLSVSEDAVFAEQLARSWAASGRRTLLLDLGGDARPLDDDGPAARLAQIDEAQAVATLSLGWSPEVVSDRVVSESFVEELAALCSTFDKVVIRSGPTPGSVASLKVLASRTEVVVVCGEGDRKADLVEALQLIPAPGRAAVVFRS